MDKREDVINGLKCLSLGAKQPCPNCVFSQGEDGCIAECGKAALDLLQNKPITDEEALDDYIDSFDGEARVWVEQRSTIPGKSYLWPASIVKRNYKRPQDPNFYDLQYEYYLVRSSIGEYWRAWRTKPTDGERKAEKWK